MSTSIGGSEWCSYCGSRQVAGHVCAYGGHDEAGTGWRCTVCTIGAQHWFVHPYGMPCPKKSALSFQIGVPTADPWAHRSRQMHCSTCMWFVAKIRLPETKVDPVRGELGRCKRHAPTLNGYPAVFEVDWCGDHKLDEAKL